MEENTTSPSTQESAPDSATNPATTDTSLTEEQLFDRVAEIITEVRPYIQSDGGDIELLKVEDNVVYVALTGACVGCPSSMVTLKHGVEARIREELPQVESVEMV